MKITRGKATHKDLPFPLLMINTAYKFVVLATGSNGTELYGFVLDVGKSTHEIGITSPTWRYEQFVPFDGKLTMEND